MTTASPSDPRVAARRSVALGVALLLACAAAVGGAGPAPAEAPGPLVQARLVAEKAALVPGDGNWIALHLRMRDGWHVYWKNPGDSGLPPRLVWQPSAWRPRVGARVASAGALRGRPARELRLRGRGLFPDARHGDRRRAGAHGRARRDGQVARLQGRLHPGAGGPDAHAAGDGRRPGRRPRGGRRPRRPRHGAAGERGVVGERRRAGCGGAHPPRPPPRTDSPRGASRTRSSPTRRAIVEPAAEQPVTLGERTIALRLTKAATRAEPVETLRGVLVARPKAAGRDGLAAVALTAEAVVPGAAPAAGRHEHPDGARARVSRRAPPEPHAVRLPGARHQGDGLHAAGRRGDANGDRPRPRLRGRHRRLVPRRSLGCCSRCAPAAPRSAGASSSSRHRSCSRSPFLFFGIAMVLLGVVDVGGRVMAAAGGVRRSGRPRRLLPRRRARHRRRDAVHGPVHGDGGRLGARRAARGGARRLHGARARHRPSLRRARRVARAPPRAAPARPVDGDAQAGARVPHARHGRVAPLGARPPGGRGGAGDGARRAASGGLRVLARRTLRDARRLTGRRRLAAAAALVAVAGGFALALPSGGAAPAAATQAATTHGLAWEPYSPGRLATLRAGRPARLRRLHGGVVHHLPGERARRLRLGGRSRRLPRARRGAHACRLDEPGPGDHARARLVRPERRPAHGALPRRRHGGAASCSRRS